MYIFLRTFSVLILILIVLFVLPGFFGSAQTQFTITEQIGSPVTVVWQTMTNKDKVPEWNRDISRLEISDEMGYKAGAELVTYFRASPQEIYGKNKLIKIIPEQQMVLRTVSDGKKSLLRQSEKDYRLKSLRDGSTEISLTVSYEPSGFMARAMDRLYLRSQLIDDYTTQLFELRKYIEKL